MATVPATIRDLRRLWKPHKQRLIATNPQHPTTIRFHRACSWFQRAEQVTEDADLDFALIHYWVAFNALYGQWDEGQREPLSDRMCWQHFLERMLTADDGRILGNVLQEHRPLVMAILEDAYLSRHFWQEPTPKRAGQSKKAKFDAQTWYIQTNWTLILDRVMERIYLLRCQLVHGASTYNSSLNRTAARRCTQMMNHLLRAMLLVWIENGADEDWGIMCYPPLTGVQHPQTRYLTR